MKGMRKYNGNWIHSVLFYLFFKPNLTHFIPVSDERKKNHIDNKTLVGKL